MSPSLSANTVSQMRKERKKKGDMIKKNIKQKWEKNLKKIIIENNKANMPLANLGCKIQYFESGQIFFEKNKPNQIIFFLHFR